MAKAAAVPVATTSSARAALAAIALACRLASAEGTLVDGLGSTDRETVAAAVGAIERAPATTPDLADALFAAARACEDTLVDPARALALYERIVRERPDARVAISAQRRAEALRGQVGAGGEHAKLATEFARLVGDANQLDPAEIIGRADALANAAWPGAPEVTLWLADWLRRDGRFDDAQSRYAAVATRWPGTPHAVLAIRGSAGCALEAHEWDRAETLASQLPAISPADRVMRDDLIAAAQLGRSRGRWQLVAWIGVIAAFAALGASLVEAAVRGGRRRRRLSPIRKLLPPIEVIFLAPIAAVLVGVALTTHQLIAPAVLTLSIGGLALAWISGTALDTLRARGRDVARRAIVHIGISLIAITGLCYIVLMRDNLLDMVIETVKFGPAP